MSNIKLSEVKIDPGVIIKVPANLVHRHNIIPLYEEDGIIKIAVSDPLAIHALDDVRLITGCEVEPVLAEEDEIKKAIKQYYGLGAETIQEMAKGIKIEEAAEEEETTESSASIIKFVDQLILEAYQSRATDIHIEPFEDDLRLRYRIDGFLHEVPAPPSIRHFHASLVSRIKIMAELDIAQKRMPQEGRIKFRIPQEELDLRISTMPTLFGESVQIRLLGRKVISFELKELGFSVPVYDKFASLVQRPNGIILVTGPTGAGKNTTLYGVLEKINSVSKKIITIEDPIEYQLKGVTQIQVHSRIGLTFAHGLRSILRIDPDIIMIGEIRDLETAEIAIRAALTGHLVFSTLHTNDAAGAIARLVDMEIEPYLVSSCLVGVLAQRLVRLICPECKEPYRPPEEILNRLNLGKGAKLYHGRGCENCRQTGYFGRTGIFELLRVDETTRRLILEGRSHDIIRQKAIEAGMKTLFEEGLTRIRSGATTIEEVLRVTQEDELLSEDVE